MGNLHIPIGSNQQYAYCPPASGPHYNNPGIDGPIPAKFYGPDDGTRPEGWIHNLEHGAVVILYNCKMGACDTRHPGGAPGDPRGIPGQPGVRGEGRRPGPGDRPLRRHADASSRPSSGTGSCT